MIRIHTSGEGCRISELVNEAAAAWCKYRLTPQSKVLTTENLAGMSVTPKNSGKAEGFHLIRRRRVIKRDKHLDYSSSVFFTGHYLNDFSLLSVLQSLEEDIHISFFVSSCQLCIIFTRLKKTLDSL